MDTFFGADRNRTDGLLSAIQALSQLSYSPDTQSRRNYKTCVFCFNNYLPFFTSSGKNIFPPDQNFVSHPSNPR